MKKVISILIAALVLMSVVSIPAFADGSILFSDNFESGAINPADWYPGAFEVSNGGPTKSYYVEDWAGWHVLQTMYNNENGSNRTFAPSVCFKVDAWAWEDGGDDADEHKVGLWYADYFDAKGDEGRIVYLFLVNYELRKAVLLASGDGGGEEFYDAAVYSGGKVVGEAPIPESIPCEMDLSEPSVLSLGMRVNGTQIDCYVNDTKLLSFTAPRMGSEKSPILLVNDGCYAGFDNFVVATADYDLFNEGANIGQQGGGQQGGGQQGGGQQGGAQQGGGTEKVIVSKSVVVGTDAEGNAITEIVTEEVVRQVAATGGNATGGNAAKTGDTAIIVVAVMIVALGSAIVVGKVRSHK